MMSKKKTKYYKVKYQGISTETMTGLEIAILQQSGASVKVLRKISVKV